MTSLPTFSNACWISPTFGAQVAGWRLVRRRGDRDADLPWLKSGVARARRPQ